MADQLNFQALYAKRTVVSPETLALLGGAQAEMELLDWLDLWQLNDLDFTWQLWETVSELHFQPLQLPDTTDLLERGRFFGADGDLSIRRDGEMFHWWYVGKPQSVPQTILHAKTTHSFWKQSADISLFSVEQSALLWGSYRGKDGEDHPYWYDDRVGWANLRYPVQHIVGEEHRHIHLHYREYLHRGQVAFVWIHNLSNKEAETNGNG